MTGLILIVKLTTIHLKADSTHLAPSLGHLDGGTETSQYLLSSWSPHGTFPDYDWLATSDVLLDFDGSFLPDGQPPVAQL